MTSTILDNHSVSTYFFLFFSQEIICDRYLLEAAYQGTSYDYHNICFVEK